MILYVENTTDSITILELITNLINLQDTKINIQKPVAFLYNNNNLSEKKIKKTIPFIMASTTIKYLGISLTMKIRICTLVTIKHL